MRSGRGLRDEFGTFYTTAYPKLAAQVLAITGDARIAKAATDTTLAKAWQAWPSLRETGNPLVRARWMAVRTAAEHQAKSAGRGEPVQEVVEGAGEAAVVVKALQLLPPVQRRALVLHYMGGVTVNDMAALSGSSAEHIELLLDDGFTTLAATLDWDDGAAPPQACADGIVEAEPADRTDELERRFDWTAEALADTAARIPDEIAVPSPAAMLRRAALLRWSARALPVAAGAACVAFAAIIAAQPGAASGLGPPTLYTQNDQGAGAAVQGAEPDVVPPADTASAPHMAPLVGLRSVALTSLLGPSPNGARAGMSGASGSGGETPRLVSVSSGLSYTSSSTAGIAAADTATSTPVVTTSPDPVYTSPPVTTTVLVPPPPVDTTTTTTPPVPTPDPVTTDPTSTDPTTTDSPTTDPTTTQDTTSAEDTTTADQPSDDNSGDTGSATAEQGAGDSGSSGDGGATHSGSGDSNSGDSGSGDSGSGHSGTADSGNS